MPAQLPAVVVSLKVMVAPLQLSVAVGLAGAGMLSQEAVVSAGHPASTGGAESVTVMFCVQLEALPQPSVAVQVRWIT